jgi:hypothetical protein
MVFLNPNNIEELLFYNKDIRKLLPKYKHLFDQWSLAQQVPSLRSLGRRSSLELLNSLNEEDLNILEKYFNDGIDLVKLNHHLVKNYKIPLNEVEESLCELEGLNITTYRDADYLYICSWR